MNEKLLDRGIYILPNEISHETYVDLAELLLTRAEPVTLYCAGDGGSIRDALAMVDLIKAHGQVTGMLAGTAASCHGVVWAGCAQRFVYPNAVLGVHKVGYGEFDRGFDTVTAEMLSRELTLYERAMSQIFAAASRSSAEVWFERIQAAGSQEYRIFTADDLYGLKMAQRVISALRDPA